MSLSPPPTGSPLTIAPAARADAPVFTRGSTMRHVAVMTATGSIGLVAVFAVDFLSLFWVSRLGVQSLKAAVGYASQLQFLAMSVNIGFTIAISATVSRALGAGDRPRARRLAASGLSIAALASAALSALMFAFRDPALALLLHAHGEAARSPATFSPSPSRPTSRWRSAWRWPACCAPPATRAARCT